VDGAVQDSGAAVTDSNVVDTSGLDTTPSDDTTEPDAFPDLGDDTDKCDRDGDGYTSATESGCVRDGGPLDCNDYTAMAHPGITDFNPANTGDPANWTTVPGDWNCDGTALKQFVQQSCSSGTSLDCHPKHDGIDGDPGTIACGANVNFVTCTVSGVLGCVTGTTGGTKMGCL